MKLHLSEDQIKNYHARKLTPTELLQMDQHMETCQDCSSRLLQNSKVDARVASLDEELNSETEEDHLEYEQLIGYVERSLDLSDREIVESHIQSCSVCAAEEKDLRAFSQIISSRKKSRTFVYRIAGIAAAIAVLALTIGVFFKKSPTEPIAFTIQDAEHQIVFNKEGRVLNPEWNLPENEQHQLQFAFEGKAIQVPEVIEELRSKKGVLLSENVPDATVRLSGPLGTVVSTERPTFRWQGPQEASGYVVSIYDTSFDLVVQSREMDQTEWTVDSALERGKTYIWMVSMRQGDRIIKAPIPPAPEARFRVLSSQELQILEQRIQQYQGSHLFAGLQYLEFGLLDDAKKEWQQLAKQNPDSIKVRSLIQSLEILRRTGN